MKLSIYTVQDVLGEGGMGKVYLASDPQGNQVAIKEMRSDLLCDAQLKERFKLEINTLSKLEHPYIVKMNGSFEIGKDNLYLVMEYVQGYTLEKYVSSQPNGWLEEDEAIRILRFILEGVEYAHNQGIVHRDLKPSNFIIHDGIVTILDFGIAKDMNSKGLTTGHLTIGTSGYMSPEQAGGYNIDRRTDIYSIGCVLYYMMTGHHPFVEQSNEQEMRMTVIREAIPRAQDINPSISKKMQELLERATDKNMLKRFQTCSEFKRAIEGGGTIHDRKIITIGRDESCDITVYDPNNKVSRIHAEVEFILNTGPSWFEFRDRSRNGTWINGDFIHNDSKRLYTDDGFSRDIALNPEINLAGTVKLAWEDIINVFNERGIRVPQKTRVTPQPPTPPTPPPTPTPRPKVIITNDKIGIGYGILSFFIPIVGWVLYAQWRKFYPNKAKWAMILAWLGFGTGLVFRFLSI